MKADGRMILQGRGPGHLDRCAAKVTQKNGADIAAWCDGEAFDVGMAPGMTHHVRVPGCGRWARVGCWVVDVSGRFLVVESDDEARVLLALGSYLGGGSTTSVAIDCSRVRPWRDSPMTNRQAIRICRDLAAKGMVVESGAKRGPKHWLLVNPVEGGEADA